MDIKKLQEELVEKILLIPTEDDSEASGKEALEIINELKDHINEIIVINNQQFTALDCVIIADSQGNDPRISERVRINNRTLKELENAIRNVGGKISEELEQVQNIHYSQDEFRRVITSGIEQAQQVLRKVEEESNRRMVREITRNLAHCALLAGSSYLVYTSGIRNDNDEEFSMSRYLTGVVGIGVYTMLQVPQVMNCLRELTLGEQERQASMSLENATVQPNIEERRSSSR